MATARPGFIFSLLPSVMWYSSYKCENFVYIV